MLQGARFVCLPIYASKNLLKCIYIENADPEFIFEFLKRRGFSFDQCKWLTEGKEFPDNSGTCFVFKHTFCLDKKGDIFKRYVVIENISDDYSGAFRVQNYIHWNRYKYLDNNLDII